MKYHSDFPVADTHCRPIRPIHTVGTKIRRGSLIRFVYHRDQSSHALESPLPSVPYNFDLFSSVG